MANLIYNSAKAAIGNGSIDWDSGGQTYRAVLCTSSYSPNQDTHVFVSDVTNELSGGGYTRKDLAGRAVTVDNTNDRADYKADTLLWSALTGAPAWCLIFKFVSTDADSPLVCALDIPDQTLNAADFRVKFDGQEVNGSVFRVS